MDFEHRLKARIFFHLADHALAIHPLRVLKKDDFASREIAPSHGIEKNRFSEANKTRGLDPFLHLFQALYAQANKTLEKNSAVLLEPVSIEGSLMDAVLSMHWTDYRKESKKAKAPIGVDLNRSIPRKMLETGQTGIMDCGYQCHAYVAL